MSVDNQPHNQSSKSECGSPKSKLESDRIRELENELQRVKQQAQQEKKQFQQKILEQEKQARLHELKLTVYELLDTCQSVDELLTRLVELIFVEHRNDMIKLIQTDKDCYDRFQRMVEQNEMQIVD